MRRRLMGVLGLVGGLTMLWRGDAAAQRPIDPPRSVFGIGGAALRPVGEFGEFVSLGGGLGLYTAIGLDRSGVMALRLDGTFVVYGHERYAVPFPTVPRVWLDVTTDNWIMTVGVGPQLTLGTGALRLYGFGTAGLSYFATISSLSGTAHDEAFASTTNFDDVTPALTGGGGLLLRLSRGRHPVSLDLGAQATWNGEAEYLLEGGVVDNPDGTITVFPIRSEANAVTFRLGIAIGL